MYLVAVMTIFSFQVRRTNSRMVMKERENKNKTTIGKAGANKIFILFHGNATQCHDLHDASCGVEELTAIGDRTPPNTGIASRNSSLPQLHAVPKCA